MPWRGCLSCEAASYRANICLLQVWVAHLPGITGRPRHILTISDTMNCPLATSTLIVPS
jgi:hypothetical protein